MVVRRVGEKVLKKTKRHLHRLIRYASARSKCFPLGIFMQVDWEEDDGLMSLPSFSSDDFMDMHVV